MAVTQQESMAHQAATDTQEEPLFRQSKSETMMELIRDDLSRQKPSKWRIVRRKYDYIFSRDAPMMRPSSDFFSVSRSLSRDSRMRIKLDDEDDIYDHRRRNIARVLKMMGHSDISPRYVSKGTYSSPRAENRLPTRGSKFSLDAQIPSTSVHRKDSVASLPPISRRKSSIRIKPISRRRSSVKQVEVPHASIGEIGTSPVTKPVMSSEHDSDTKPMNNSGRLKKLARFLILLLRGWRLHSKKVHEILDGFGAVGATKNLEASSDSILFDLSYYKVKKEEKVPINIKQLLGKRPRDRTPEDINTIQLSFRNYRSIMLYPENLQRMIAERAWFETYGPKKVMVREGHPPWQFYFILSGSAVVCVMDENSRLKTIVHLGRGDPFGELAIINRSRRHSTVISQDQIELLCLTHEDFVDIFMSGGLNDPEDTFLQSLWYLKNWPLHRLVEHPEKALISYFQRHTVLVPDSNASDWLYIVKSGSCEVLKVLKKVVNTKVRPLPKLQEFREQKKIRHEDPKYLTHEQLLHLKLEKQIEKVAQENNRLRRFVPEINIRTHESYDKLLARREPTDFLKRKPEREKSTLERLVSQKPHMGVSKRISQMKDSNQDSEGAEDFTSFKEGLLLRQTGNDDRESRDLVRRGAINVKRPPQEYNFSQNSIFVTVGTLTKGEVFGLHELVYQHQPSMCLVSNGAEIVLINKKFYLEHASDSLIRKLRSEVIAFPSENKLQAALEADITWEHTRKVSLRQSLQNLKFKKVDINDARSRYPHADRNSVV